MTGAPDINVEEIMAKIREGIARRRIVGGGAGETAAVAPPAYDHAYDHTAAQVAALQAGSDIYNVPLTSHRPGIGSLIVLVKRVLRKLLTPFLSRQAEYNAGNAQVVAGLAEQVNAMERVQDETVRGQAQELHAAHDRLDAMAREHARLQGEMVALDARMDALELDHGRLRNDVMAPEIQALEDRLGSFRERLGMLGAEQQGTRERVARAERKLRRMLHDSAGNRTLEGRPVPPEKAEGFSEPPEEFDYIGFEERYRGSEEEIKGRFRPYVERFKGAAGVLDIGCGRGEFLELLRDSRVEARGVDLDLDMVLLCREKGLDVVKGDGLSHLASLPDESLDGVFASQVIEHLEAAQIVRLVQLAHRKLRPGGVLILETPNPRCLTVFAETFYMDLTHIRPIHPGAAKFLLESVGFRNVELRFSSPVEPTARVPALPAASFPPGSIDEFNRGLERMNELLYGCQDYAVIGEKLAVLS
jgi:SAM-dependent methyltransferase